MKPPTRFSYPASLLLALLLLLGGCKKDSPNTPPDTPPDTPPAPPVPPPTTAPSGPSQVAVWLTTPDKTVLFERQKTVLNFDAAANSDPVISIDTTQTFQTMDGFGYTLTGGSAYVMSLMLPINRTALIRELFATDSTCLGVSYLRISIGASDLSSQVYTYDDSSAPDPNLNGFSLAQEQAYLIPVLREILAVNPNIKILGSPWTAPSWMKSNNSPVGGSLLPQYYAAYAQYFVKYIQGMQAAGVPIDAVTLQNEPLNPYNNPSMVMTGTEQANFIKNNVGPAFRAAGLSTKIIAYDHNPDAAGLAFANTVLSDPAASAYTDGTAFHLYAGTIGALNSVHDNFPNKNLYFTEQWTQAPGTNSFAGDLAYHVGNLEIGGPRNWCRNVLEWNLASDQNYGPHTPGGCTQCLGAVTITGNAVTRNVAYYAVAHASKFVRPGSVRVASNQPPNLPNVAYKTPSGKRVLLVLNNGASTAFNIQYKGKTARTSLPVGAVATYVW